MPARGRLIGLGVGPGDPELITLKALRLLRESPVVAYFVAKGKKGNAFGIIEDHLVAQQTLTAEHFSTTDGGCLLGKAGRSRFYAAYEENAADLRRALTQEIKTLARLVNPDLPEPDTKPATPEPGDPEAPPPWAT